MTEQATPLTQELWEYYRHRQDYLREHYSVFFFYESGFKGSCDHAWLKLEDDRCMATAHAWDDGSTSVKVEALDSPALEDLPLLWHEQTGVASVHEAMKTVLDCLDRLRLNREPVS